MADGSRLLWIDRRVPDRRLGGGAPRACWMLEAAAAQGRHVTLVATHAAESWVGATTPGLQGVSVHGATGPAAVAALLADPSAGFDVVVASRRSSLELVLVLAARDPALRAGRRLVFDAEAVRGGALELDAEGLVRPREAAPGWMREEADLARHADAAIAVSDRDATLLREQGARDVHVVGFAAAPSPQQRPFALRRGILFVGAARRPQAPNLVGLRWLVEAILPLLGAAGDRPPLVLAGERAPSARLPVLPADARDLGPVDDLAPLYAAARVFVAPTPIAAGIPLKVLHAAAHGLPVVATSLLATQLGWQDGRELLVADTPPAFAAAVRRLHDDEALWTALRANALAAIARDCDPARTAESLRRALG